jgi:hypothetical protein
MRAIARSQGIGVGSVSRHLNERRQRSAEEKIWRVVRMLKRSTSAEIEAGAGVSSATARRWIARLRRAGYLSVVGRLKMCRGRGSARRIYHLAKDTGPRPPRIARDGTVFDPNLGGADARAARRRLHGEP